LSLWNQEICVTASWLLNAAYAADWQAFQSTGGIKPAR
jgi:hypothetical protein